MKPIIHADRNIGSSQELPPGPGPGAPGPWQEIIRTEGAHEEAQMLAVSLGVSLAPSGAEPHGPLAAQIVWGVRGGTATVEIDLPLGGISFGVVASQIAVNARYDGLLLVNGAQLDPAAKGGADLTPKPRVTAMVGYGTPGRPSRLTRTFRFDDLLQPGIDMGISRPVRLPSFARSVTVTGVDLRRNSFAIRAFGFDEATVLEEHEHTVGEVPREILLGGDVALLDLANRGPAALRTPALVFGITF